MRYLVLLVAAAALAIAEHEGSPVAPKKMYFGIYSVSEAQRGHQNLAKAAENQATSAGPYYGASANPISDPLAQRERASAATRFGLGFAGHVPPPPSAFDSASGKVTPARLQAIPVSALRAHVRRVIDRTLADSLVNSALKVWFILPEELRPWNAAEMAYLRAVATEIRRYDPLRRPVTMYNPGNRGAAQLDSIAKKGLDWLMLGIYVTDVSFSQRAAAIQLRADRLVTAARRTQTSPTAVFQLSRDFDSTELEDLSSKLGGSDSRAAIRQVVRHDVYQALALGVLGVQVWSGCDCRRGLTTFPDQYDAYLSVANDLNGPLRLSEVFLRGERREDIRINSDAGAQVTMSQWSLGLDRFVLVVNGAVGTEEIVLRGDALTGVAPSILIGNPTFARHHRERGELRLAIAPLDAVMIKIGGN